MENNERKVVELDDYEYHVMIEALADSGRGPTRRRPGRRSRGYIIRRTQAAARRPSRTC